MSDLDLLPESRLNYTEKVLKTAAAGTLIGGAVIAPNILGLLVKLIPNEHSEQTKLLRAVRYAKKQGWLTIKEDAKGVRVALTASGKVKWRKVELEQPLYVKQWDGIWRVVLFDIPVEKRASAEAFRAALKKLGFLQLQRSVWVVPYPCSTEIAALRQIYELKPYVRMLEAKAIDDEAQLLRKFNL